MAEITASLVKELREITGAGMMECKKALTEAEADVEKAIDVLRARGLAAVAKKAGRATNEGIASALVSDDARTAALVEVNCETDFVSRNEVFGGYVKKIAQAVFDNNPADLESLKASSVEGETVEAVLTDAIHTIGENIQIARFVRRTVDTGAISSYIHGGGRLGVLVCFKLGSQATAEADAFKTLAKDVAMQVAAANPGAVTRDGFSEEIIAREVAIYKAKAAESGKPENIQEKIAEGNLRKFYQENTLVEQAFVKDPDKTVQEVIAGVAKSLSDSIEVIGFDRFEVGQG
ncbi:MAG: translation elongation factor Ts [Coriobacteriales bacterium]|jgi:elongation factor Ts|nr:translation elongation factor Ts [Coriobacteriales bacterium]